MELANEAETRSKGGQGRARIWASADTISPAKPLPPWPASSKTMRRLPGHAWCRYQACDQRAGHVVTAMDQHSRDGTDLVHAG